jgi:rhodanese-related sulfurtransferase
VTQSYPEKYAMLNALLRMFTGGPSADSLTPIEARDRQKAGALILDVREADEWRSGHAPGAKHVPLGQLPARLAELPRDRDVIAMCRSGMRSARATGVLRDAGFTHVFNLSGGIAAWTAAGLPTKR